MAGKIILLFNDFSTSSVVEWLDKKYLVEEFRYQGEYCFTLKEKPTRELRERMAEFNKLDIEDEAKERKKSISGLGKMENFKLSLKILMGKSMKF